MMKTTDFSSPQRMSLGALFIYMCKFATNFGTIALTSISVGIFNTDDRSLSVILLLIGATLGALLAIALILACAVYFQFKFHVEGGNLIYRHYIISRATTTIPLSRIHALRTRQGILYRLLDMRGILFDTLANPGEEVELILSESDWQSLLKQIEHGERAKPEAHDVPPVYDPTTTLKFSNDSLLLDAICQNHLKGMVVLAGFIGLFLDSLSDLSQDMIIMLAGFLESSVGSMAMSVAGGVIFLVATWVISLVLWIGKVMLKYSNMSLTYDSKMLTFTYGLLSRMSSRFSCDKICTLWVKRNFLEKHLGLCTIALRQALNASSKKEEDNLRIYGRDRADFFIGWWLGRGYKTETEIITAKSGRGVFTVSIAIPLIISLVATIALCSYGYFFWTIAPAIYLLFSIAKGICAMRRSHISLKESYIIISNGRFAEIKNYLKYDNVEVVRLTRSPLSKLTGRVSLSLSTSGTTFTVRSLREPEAREIYELLLAKTIINVGQV